MPIVISLGGSFLFEKRNEIDNLFDLINDIKDKFLIVTGGGILAREYINFAKQFKLGEEDLHYIGILSTRINARIISIAYNVKYSEEDPRKLKLNEKVKVMGGYLPGWTTDVCAAYAAKSLKSKIIVNLSKEKGVYDKDPNKFKDAKLLKSISFSALRKLLTKKRYPGANYIFDPLAAEICKRNNISVIVTNYVEDIRKYVDGKKVNGTIII
ncbi:MAG: UMP kinase [Candidatus Rehaiarchaeum fermentans]|nr:UMP kinase [Candidatus Rehaiarchaeum fermentans]